MWPRVNEMGMMRVRDVETGTGDRKRVRNKWKMMRSDQSPWMGDYWLPGCVELKSRMQLSHYCLQKCHIVYEWWAMLQPRTEDQWDHDWTWVLGCNGTWGWNRADIRLRLGSGCGFGSGYWQGSCVGIFWYTYTMDHPWFWMVSCSTSNTYSPAFASGVNAGQGLLALLPGQCQGTTLCFLFFS